MTRQALTVALGLFLVPATLLAQAVPPAPPAQFTVNVASAAVRKGPSTGSPVVGHAQRGAALEVARDIGAWVKVVWSEAPDGVGYVHQSMGTLSARQTRDERLAAAFTPTAEPVVSPTIAPAIADPVASEPVASTRTVYVPAPTHLVGFGGQLMGASPGYGFTSRVWSRRRIGVQLDLTQSRLTNSTSAERVTSTQFSPSVVVSLADYVSDSVWLRPYVGGGAAVMRSKWSVSPEVGATQSDSMLGWRGFGGAEITLPSLPRFAISADVGYQWSDQPYAGFELGGVGFSISGHWYVK